MKDQRSIFHLTSLLHRYLFRRGVEVLIWAMAVFFIVFFTGKIIIASTGIIATFASLLGSIVALIVTWRLNLFNMNEKRLALFLNQNYPILRHSADLLLRNDEELTTLQQLQKKETKIRLEQLYPTIRLPHHVGRATVALALSIVVSFSLTSFLANSRKIAVSDYGAADTVSAEKKFLPTFIRACTITVSPPSYTQVAKHTISGFDLQIQEAAIVIWNITFDGQVLNPAIIFSGRDTLALSGSTNQYSGEKTFVETGFYQLTWTNPDSSVKYSDYYKLEVIKDKPPSIQIENLNQYLELQIKDSPKVNLAAIVEDDYGLREASIVATVSKGTGEAVKFREEKLKFHLPKQISGKRIQASRLLDLLALGLEPGDELYFYVEASDNKVPNSNRARTDTYFITLQDTSSLTNSVEASLGADLMPEYFRSQRQIIIDSEKLLREKKQITKQNFNERSNELGYDQKVLRLRYGQFLGEEFESGIGPQTANGNERESGNISEEFGHQHDRENEHNLVEEKPIPKESHSHSEENSLPGQAKNPLEEFVHAHDSDEEASFFVQSIKAKLKAAVNVMWDAELYLRLYQPEKSLPYQYQALKLLKEISQDSRIYVHRTGFDPPPLKEEKRLTGDLSEIRTSASKIQSAGKEETYPSIRTALTVIERLVNDDTVLLSENTKEVLSKAGNELATLALKQPGKFLTTLSALKLVIQDEVNQQDRKSILIKIRSDMWKALPQESLSPRMPSGTLHDLDKEFLESLEKVKLNN